jgi:predicted PurR-regulated permease PerM
VTVNNQSGARADPFRVTILIFAVIGFMYFTGEVLKPLALSVLLSFALAPVAGFFERCLLPRAAAVILTVVLSLGLVGGVGYVVGVQLTSLAQALPDYQENIDAKIHNLIEPLQRSAARRLSRMAAEVTSKIEKPPASEPDPKIAIPRVEVVARPSFQERLRSTVGPYVEFLGVASFVLILVFFMLMGRDHLTDRIVGVFGNHQVNVTARTMHEMAQRISRYLATFALVNSGFGLVIGVGLAAVGVPYAVLWGTLAALLRFIPYVGAAVAFFLPFIFSFAQFRGWIKPLEVVALFGLVEVVLTSFLEPFIYGKMTGISSLGLLVAAMFWTWLWGAIGLLLSTPLTVCLAVLGKYVPAMRFFAALLNEGAEVAPDVRFYQRLVALDRRGALELVEQALVERAPVEVFDQVLIPALCRWEHDATRDELDQTKQQFVWSVVAELLDKLETLPPASSLTDFAPTGPEECVIDGFVPGPAPAQVVGMAADDTSDILVLRMLAQILAPTGCLLRIITDGDSTLELAEHVADETPRLVVVSHLPPVGLTLARYLVRRMRAHFGDLPIVVGRWGDCETAAGPAEQLTAAGATRVVSTLADARNAIIGQLFPQKKKEPASAALPA